MAILNKTPRDSMLDARGRPYFLWDTDMTLDRFEQLLRTGDAATRGRLLDQAEIGADEAAEIATAGAADQARCGRARDGTARQADEAAHHAVRPRAGDCALGTGVCDFAGAVLEA